jgi:hypothetical protein
MPNIKIGCSKNETSPPPWDVQVLPRTSPHVVDFVIAGLYPDDDALFSGFVTWTADILTARGVSAATLFPTLDLVGKQRWQQHPPSPTRRVRRPTPN